MKVETPVTGGDGDLLHKAVLDCALDGIITIAGAGRILEFNPAAERIFGWSADDVVGRDLADVIVPPELRERHREGLRRYLATGEGRMLDRRVETLAQHADGHCFPVELAITRIPLPGPPLFTGHIRDITDRKRDEEELRLSRARLVTAGDEARRRLERDLHDGAQQRLVALALDIRLTLGELDGEAPKAREALERIGEQLAIATQELRDFARGIHPATLTEHGLFGALEAIAGLCPLPVELAAVPEERLPQAIEATAYFVVCESLANAARYASASSVHVAVTHVDGVVTITVRDDGAGGADPDAGSGLAGLADRVAALGGTLEFDSPPGQGTVVRAVLPCG